MKNSNLLLCGLPGVGKTTIGKYLAAAANRPFIDTDDLIEQTYGSPCREIFLREGKKKFRSYETLVLQSLSPSRNLIISLGGGIVEEEENRQWIARLGIVVHIVCDPEILIARKVRNDNPAYLNSHDKESEFMALATCRFPLYSEIQDFEIDVSRLSLEKIIESIQKKTCDYGQ